MTILKYFGNRSLLVALALFALFTTGAWAQSTATLSGVVTDPTGAGVPRAQVVVPNSNDPPSGCDVNNGGVPLTVPPD